MAEAWVPTQEPLGSDNMNSTCSHSCPVRLSLAPKVPWSPHPYKYASATPTPGVGLEHISSLCTHHINPQYIDTCSTSSVLRAAGIPPLPSEMTKVPIQYFRTVGRAAGIFSLFHTNNTSGTEI